MEPEVYGRFLQTASEVSKELRKAVEEIGPIDFPKRKDHGVAYFLATAVVGQQLSTKAARSIWRRVEGSAKSSGMGIPGFFEQGNEGVLKRNLQFVLKSGSAGLSHLPAACMGGM